MHQGEPKVTVNSAKEKVCGLERCARKRSACRYLTNWHKLFRMRSSMSRAELARCITSLKQRACSSMPPPFSQGNFQWTWVYHSSRLSTMLGFPLSHGRHF